ncbi:unnamed protein product, partial [Phaeothamnion confervicola]
NRCCATISNVPALPQPSHGTIGNDVEALLARRRAATIARAATVSTVATTAIAATTKSVHGGGPAHDDGEGGTGEEGVGCQESGGGSAGSAGAGEIETAEEAALRRRAMAKLWKAAAQCGGRGTGAAAVASIKHSFLKPDVFRDFMRAQFGVKLTDVENEAVFGMLDADGDGVIDGAEFRSLFYRLVGQANRDQRRHERLDGYRRQRSERQRRIRLELRHRRDEVWMQQFISGDDATLQDGASDAGSLAASDAEFDLGDDDDSVGGASSFTAATSNTVTTFNTAGTFATIGTSVMGSAGSGGSIGSRRRR